MRRAFLRGFAAVILVAGLLGGGWLWARDASFARVTEVEITGTTTSEGDAVRAALERAARDMTTLRVREEVLHEAVAPYRSVAGLRVERDLLHGLRIQVLERRPVAALEGEGHRTPVAGDGTVLSGVQADATLPAIEQRLPAAGTRVKDERTRAALAVPAAAPPELLERADELYFGPEGLTADLSDGPPLFFGDGDDAAAKWAAAARVLAAPSAAGATYLDLRVPGRVAAGGLGPVPQETPSPEPQP